MTDPKEPAAIEVTQPAPLAAPAPLAGSVELEDSFADATLEMDESGTKFRVGSVAGVEGQLKDPQVANRIKTTAGSVAISPTAPSTGQVLTASGPTGASWAEPAAGGGGGTGVVDGQLLTGSETGVLVAGKDPSNNAQFLATETSGMLRVSDGGGSLTVDGTVGVSGTVPVSSTSLATEASLATRLADTTFTARVPTLGAKTSALSSPVVLASDQAALPINDGGNSITVDGAVTVTNLLKSEDAPAASGDAGVVALGVYQPDTVGVSAGAAGDYATLNIDERGRLRVSPGAYLLLEGFSSITGFTGLNGDTGNIAASTNHIRGTSAVSFDKLDTAANSLYGLIQKTIPAVDLTHLFTGVTYLQLMAYLPALDNILNVVVRLGTDASNYNSWSFPVADARAAVWQVYRATIGNSNASVGNGWNPAAVTYLAVGVEMAAQTNTLSGIVVDSLAVNSGQLNAGDLSSEVAAVAASSKVDVVKVGGGAVAVSVGTANSSTQRVVIASNDPNLSAIAAATPPVGQAAMAASSPVVIASNQSAVPVTEATLVARTPTLGQKTMSAASPVVIASDQSAVPVSGTVGVSGTVPISATQLPASVGQKTGAGSLSVVLASDQAAQAITSTQLPASLGQKAMAASSPVVIASDQVAIPISSATLALDATLTGGSQKAIARGAAKGSTAAADVTSTAEGTNNQALDVQIYHGGAAKDPTAIRALTATDVVSVNSGYLPQTGTLSSVSSGVGLALAGRTGAAVLLNATAFVGTITAYASFDNGTNYFPIYWYDVAPGVAGATYAQQTVGDAFNIAVNTNKHRALVIPPGTTHVRLGCTAYTSGTLNYTLSASMAAAVPQIAPPAVGYSGQFTVGATSSELVYSDGGGGSGQGLQSGVEIRCDQDSPGHLIIRAGGAAGSDYTTTGYRVYQGQAVFLAINSLNGLVVQGSVASSKGSYLAS